MTIPAVLLSAGLAVAGCKLEEPIKPEADPVQTEVQPEVYQPKILPEGSIDWTTEQGPYGMEKRTGTWTNDNGDKYHITIGAEGHNSVNVDVQVNDKPPMSVSLEDGESEAYLHIHREGSDIFVRDWNRNEYNTKKDGQIDIFSLDAGNTYWRNSKVDCGWDIPDGSSCEEAKALEIKVQNAFDNCVPIVRRVLADERLREEQERKERRKEELKGTMQLLNDLQ